MKLKEWLKKEKISHVALAKSIECHPQLIRMYIRGTRNLSIPLAKAIAEYTENVVCTEELLPIKPISTNCPCCSHKLSRKLYEKVMKKHGKPKTHKDDNGGCTYPIPYVPE